MADIFKLKEKTGNLVCDATPDPPRSVNNNSVGDRPNLSQDQQKNEQKTNVPTNNDESSTSNTTSDKSDKPKSENIKFSKPKNRSKSTTINNYNIVNADNVKLGNTFVHKYYTNTHQNINYQSCNNKCSNKKEGKKNIKEMPPHILFLSKSKEVINTDDMLEIHVHLGKGWKEVAEQLGFSEGQIYQFEIDNKSKNIGEVIYQVLLQWKQMHTDNATIGHLVCALWSAQEYDCVEKLAIARKIDA